MEKQKKKNEGEIFGRGGNDFWMKRRKKGRSFGKKHGWKGKGGSKTPSWERGRRSPKKGQNTYR